MSFRPSGTYPTLDCVLYKLNRSCVWLTRAMLFINAVSTSSASYDTTLKFDSGPSQSVTVELDSDGL
jgi:hypothetical protein